MIHHNALDLHFLLGLNEYIDTSRNQGMDQQVHGELPIGTDNL